MLKNFSWILLSSVILVSKCFCPLSHSSGDSDEIILNCFALNYDDSFIFVISEAIFIKDGCRFGDYYGKGLYCSRLGIFLHWTGWVFMWKFVEPSFYFSSIIFKKYSKKNFKDNFQKFIFKKII